MATNTLPSSVRIEQRSGRQHVVERRLHWVISASLVLHAIVFTVLTSHENLLPTTPPGIIVVDMATLPPPELKTVVVTKKPEHVLHSPRAQAPTALLHPVVNRQVVAPLVNAPLVPMAPVSENIESKLPASKQEMSVPIAAPIAHRALNNAPSFAPIANQHPPNNTTNTTTDSVEKQARARMSYKAQIAALIDRNKEYPLFARKAGQQGTCSVRCTMICDGTIKRVELVKSSGSALLDKAGLRAVSDVGKFPPPPHDGGCTEVSFEVPISFHLG